MRKCNDVIIVGLPSNNDVIIYNQFFILFAILINLSNSYLFLSASKLFLWQMYEQKIIFFVFYRLFCTDIFKSWHAWLRIYSLKHVTFLVKTILENLSKL